MNHRLFGKFFSLGILFLTLIATVFGCSDSIPGQPAKIVEEYVKAVQSNDFEKIYQLNFLTARQKIFIVGKDKVEVESLMREHFELSKKRYDESLPQDEIGLQWAEKDFFTPNALIEVDKARYPPAAADDPVNAEYEKDQNAFVTVRAVYKDKDEAPLLLGKRVVEAEYDCILKKIRQPGTVRVYSHDEQWYIGGCIMDRVRTKVESSN
jgi:hypothetical protein